MRKGNPNRVGEDSKTIFILFVDLLKYNNSIETIMARVVPDRNSLSTLSLSSNGSLIDPRLLNSNNNNNENENENVWEVNLNNAYTKANIPRLVRLNAQKRLKEYGNAIPSLRNAMYETAAKAVKNEEKHALSMFAKKSRRHRATRRRRRRN